MVQLNPKETIMMIDTSYFIFYRYYAVFNWFKLSQDTSLDVSNILQNKQFMEKFEKLFETNLQKLQKKNKVPFKNIVFVKDCARDQIWRYAFFDNYKKSRDDRQNTFNGDIFKYCYTQIIPKLQAKYGVQSCEHNCSEADDIIAVFTRTIRKRSPDTRIVIITNDNDYLQLIDDHVTILNLKLLDLSSRLAHEPMKYLQIKIILGDKSDNIPSVFKKCGEKKALQMVENPALLEEKLSKSDELKARYDLNTMLIDTRCIPQRIQEEIVSLLCIKS